MKSVDHSISDHEFEQLSKNSTCGHSGCDIASLAREAAMRPVRELTSALQTTNTSNDSSECKEGLDLRDSLGGVPTPRSVTYEDFAQSLSVVTPSCGAATTVEE